MTTNETSLVAGAIVELSKAFINNYFRALNEARINIGDVSNLTDNDIAQALASASDQNADLIEFFGS